MIDTSDYYNSLISHQTSEQKNNNTPLWIIIIKNILKMYLIIFLFKTINPTDPLSVSLTVPQLADVSLINEANRDRQ